MAAMQLLAGLAAAAAEGGLRGAALIDLLVERRERVLFLARRQPKHCSRSWILQAGRICRRDGVD